MSDKTNETGGTPGEKPFPLMKVSLAIVAATLTVALFATGLALYFAQPPAPTVRSTGEALIGGPFELVTHEGETVTEAVLEGKYSLIYFGFTYCPDVCPTELNKMTVALDKLGREAERVRPVFVTVDPERDTPETIATYLDFFHDDFLGLTGTPEQVKAAADAYRVYFKKVEDEGSNAGYLMDHTSIVYLMGPDGKFVDHFSAATTPDEMAARLEKTVG